ncbi:MAG: FRG domain-containing protein [Prevotella sp.]|nr:FRG domain-containing protein [Prevotella sp.]
MTLYEVIQYINKALNEGKFPLDWVGTVHSYIGKFEIINSGTGNGKYLMPITPGGLHFLYRGQNKEFAPCLPSIYRNNPSEAEIFVERMRLTIFKRMLNSHPIVTGFFRPNDYYVDEEGLAQHYGLKTSILDLTSNLNVALFFATCKYDSNSDMYSCYNDLLVELN